MEVWKRGGNGGPLVCAAGGGEPRVRRRLPRSPLGGGGAVERCGDRGRVRAARRQPARRRGVDARRARRGRRAPTDALAVVPSTARARHDEVAHRVATEAAVALVYRVDILEERVVEAARAARPNTTSHGETCCLFC